MNRRLRRLVQRETNDNVCGAVEDDDRVTVFVQRKLKPATIQRYIRDPNKPEWTPRDFLPERLRTGLLTEKEVDVVEVGHVKALLTDRGQYRPVKGGVEISIVNWPFVGTAGMPVRFTRFGGWALVGGLKSFAALLARLGHVGEQRTGLLTNSHVANRSVLSPKHESITQPGYANSPIIGRTVYSAPVNKDGDNRFDASVVEVDDDVVVDDEIHSIGRVLGVRYARVGEDVFKRGRTTRLLEGVCTHRRVSMRIDFGPDGIIWFSNLDMFTNISQGGDSGSAIIAQDDNHAVSLLFAGDGGQYSFGIPMPEVFKDTGIELP